MKIRNLAVVLFVAIGAASATVSAAPGQRPDAGPAFTRIMTIVLENASYDDALRQPFLAGLARRGALMTHFFAESHPSQPNYIALISGSTQGVTTDDNVTVDARHIGDLLEAKGLDWKVYAEDYTGNCFLGARAGAYVRKHVPFLSFKNVTQVPARCAKIVGASELAVDVSKGSLPAYALYVPNLKNDGHDTGVAYADRWLSAMLAPLLNNPQFMKGMLLVVTFDEGKHWLFGGNRVATVLIGDSVKPGTVLDADYNHYALLRLVEDTFGLGSLGRGDAHARPIVGAWK